jgi:hypothetical protein
MAIDTTSALSSLAVRGRPSAGYAYGLVALSASAWALFEIACASLSFLFVRQHNRDNGFDS